MVTERHNIAARMIAKAISKGAYGGNMVYTGMGVHQKWQNKALLPPNQLQTEPFHSGSFLISIHPS